MLYRPPRVRGALIASILTGWAGILAGLLFVRAVTLDVSLAMFLAYVGSISCAGLAALLLYWTQAIVTLRYIVDRNALAIQFGGVRQLIPLTSIERLIPGRNVAEPQISGLNAPGLHVGRGFVERVGDTLFYSTHTKRDQLLYVVTAEKSYALTVEDPSAFAQAIQDRQGKEVVKTRQGPIRTTLSAQGFWSDPAACALLALAVLLGLSLGGYVFWRYPGLPGSMEFAFPPLGGVVRVAARKEILQIPFTALAILAVNIAIGLLVHRVERMAAYVLWGSAAMLQLLFCVAAYTALT